MESHLGRLKKMHFKRMQLNTSASLAVVSVFAVCRCLSFDCYHIQGSVVVFIIDGQVFYEFTSRHSICLTGVSIFSGLNSSCWSLQLRAVCRPFSGMINSILWTGCGLALSLLSGINAQSIDVSLTRASRSFPATSKDLFASGTSSLPVLAPTATGEPCGRIAAAAQSATSLSRVAVSAELAYDCLTSVRVRPIGAMNTINAIEKMVQF